ncbi:hypothetical protein M9458_014853, partial [Cirrhinus mrigala]
MLVQTTFLSSVAPDGELFPALLERSSYDLHSVDPAELELLSSTKASKRTQVAPTDITPAFVDIHTARRG